MKGLVNIGSDWSWQRWLVMLPLGLVVWFGFDLFMEFFVFEWLQWNGTTKNDPFFIAWWLVTLAWLVIGGRGLYRAFQRATHRDQTNHSV